MTEGREEQTYGPGTQDSGHLIVTPGALVLSLTPEQMRKAQECLERSGEVKFSLREVSVTSLREIQELGDGVLID